MDHNFYGLTIEINPHRNSGRTERKLANHWLEASDFKLFEKRKCGLFAK